MAYAGNIFWVVAFALLTSWLVAVTFTPYLGVKLLPNFKRIEGAPEAIYGTPSYKRLRSALSSVVDNKRKVAAAVLALFFVATFFMGFVKQQFFPVSDRPEVLVEVQMPEGTSIEATSAATAAVEAWLRRQPEAKIISAYVGQGASRFYLPFAPELPEPSLAKIIVLTPSEKDREALKHRMREVVAQGLAPAARIRVTQLVFGPYSPFPSLSGSWVPTRARSAPSRSVFGR